MGDITTILSNNEEYKQLINSLLQRIKQTRMQTAIGVNSQLIKSYIGLLVKTLSKCRKIMHMAMLWYIS